MEIDNNNHVENIIFIISNLCSWTDSLCSTTGLSRWCLLFPLVIVHSPLTNYVIYYEWLSFQSWHKRVFWLKSIETNEINYTNIHAWRCPRKFWLQGSSFNGTFECMDNGVEFSNQNFSTTERDGTQAYGFRISFHCIVVCCNLRVTSHMRPKARDHCILRSLVGRKGRERPSSRHNWRQSSIAQRNHHGRKVYTGFLHGRLEILFSIHNLS